MADEPQGIPSNESNLAETPLKGTESQNASGLREYHGIKYDPNDVRFQGLSKRAMKRLLKEESWEANREERNAKLKEKRKRKTAERLEKIQQGLIEPKAPKRLKPDEQVPSKVRVVFDCAFTSYMSEKEMKSTQSQLVRCYSGNTKAKHPMPMILTSYDAELRKLFEQKCPGHERWKGVSFVEEPYIDKYSKDELIYLSADSDNVIQTLEEDKVYIIGAIVDKNRHKNLCNDKANQQGIKTGQLPIGEYIKMASRKVLTVNQVYEIMLKWLEYRDWEKAFMDVIPKRKLDGSQWLSENKEDEGDEETSGKEHEQGQGQEEEGQQDNNPTSQEVAKEEKATHEETHNEEQQEQQEQQQQQS